MKKSDEGHSLLVEFDSDAPEFVRGFEAGRLWEQLKDPDPFGQTIHANNAEMVIRMCEQVQRDFSAEELDETWIYLKVE